MSEYVTVEALPTDDPDVIEISTNQTLSQTPPEIYANPDAGDVGSTLAQTLFTAVEGIAALTITADSLIIRRSPDADWEGIIDDVRDALRDFFL